MALKVCGVLSVNRALLSRAERINNREYTRVHAEQYSVERAHKPRSDGGNDDRDFGYWHQARSVKDIEDDTWHNEEYWYHDVTQYTDR
jgi:hypothetical protein